MGRRPLRAIMDGGGPGSAEKKARERAARYKKMKQGLLKKAGELASLCAVPVAVVASLPGGGVPDDVWESEEGVLGRYCALPASRRAGHSHARYLEEQVAKETSKLARILEKGPAKLAPPDSMLSAMSLDELCRLLDTVDAALLATAERKKALGLPVEEEDGVPCTGGNFGGLEGYQTAPPIDSDDYAGLLDHAMLDASYPYAGMLQYIVGDYPPPEQTQGDGNHRNGLLAPGSFFHAPNAGVLPSDGCFRFADFSSNLGYQMPTAAQDNGHAVNGAFPLQEMWLGDAHVNAGSFMNTPLSEVGHLGMATAGDVAGYVDGFETPCSSNDLHYSGSTSFMSSASDDELHYLAGANYPMFLF